MGAGSGEKRVALVIGNAVYKYADPLRNPANDARAIARALSRLGFSGTKPRLNLDYSALRQALQEFGIEADGADMAVLYFAGHGVEVDGRNFLIPVNAKLERAKAVDFETASLDQALNAVDGARRLCLIILDACRNNPFRARLIRAGGTRSIGQGLRSIEPGGNVLVAYAAKHGTFALDGNGSNSPFAEALLGHIEKPGIEISQLFREVRDDVLEQTGGEQEPYIYGTLGRAMIYLKPPVEPTVVPAKPPIGVPSSDFRPMTGGHLMRLPRGVFIGSFILVLLIIVMFIALPYPTGVGPPVLKMDFNQTPKQKDTENDAQKDYAAFAAAVKKGTGEALIDYLQQFPSGRNVVAARNELKRIQVTYVPKGGEDAGGTLSSNTQALLYYAQIAARNDEISIFTTLAEMPKKYPILNAYTLSVRKADLGEKGTWYRILAGPFNDKGDGDALCAALSGAGFKACFVRTE